MNTENHLTAPAHTKSAAKPRRRFRRRLVVASASLLALGCLSAQSAFAAPSVTKSTTGAKATCTLTRTGTFSATAKCYLYDTAADGYGVYIKHQVLAFPEKRSGNWSGGNGSVGYVEFKVSSDTPTFNWHFKVCRDRPLTSDNCSSWGYLYV